MSKTVWIIIAVVVLVVAGGGLYMLLKNSKPTNSTTSQSNTATTNQSSNTGQSSSTNTPAATTKVTIANFTFTPSSITVKKGATVTWTNLDGATHTVTENDGQTGPDSGNLVTGKSYSFTFNTVGTFNYHCTIHTSLMGSVVVTE